MKALEFIKESTGIVDSVAEALPATYVIPALQNQDPYRQYRFGVALAASKNAKESGYTASSSWGENLIIVTYDDEDAKNIDDALKQVGLNPSDKKLVSTKKSEESKQTNKSSPVAQIKKNKYGV